VLDGREAAVSTPAAAYPERTPLTASQHILHLLLTVFTAGLWLPVWIVRAWRGNAPQAPA
jgi:hypothetical protein